MDARRAGGTVHLVFGLIQPAGAIFSATCLTTSGQEEAPDDLRATLEPMAVLRELRPFASYPNVVSFLADAWRQWYSVLGDLPKHSWIHARFSNAVRI